MLKRSRVVSLFAASLFCGCVEDFPCTADTDCQERFGQQTLCAERLPGIGKHCYLSADASTNPDMNGDGGTDPDMSVNVIARKCTASIDVVVSKSIQTMAYFGNAVAATGGSTVLVGAFNYMSNNGYAEVVNVGQAGSPQQAALFSALPSDTRVGYGVSILGTTALVTGQQAAYLVSTPGAAMTLHSTVTANSGAFYYRGAALTNNFAFLQNYLGTQNFVTIYQLSSGSFGCMKSFSSSIMGFGDSLNLNSRWLAIGVSGGSAGTGSQVCMYDYMATACPMNPACTPLSRSITAVDGFGTAVALSGDLLVTGAPLQSGTSVQPFFAYEYGSGTWAESSAQPAGFVGSSGAQWGKSVALDGDLLAVGAPGGDSGKGQAQIYQWRNRQWSLLSQLTVPTGTGTSPTLKFDAAQFGTAVAVSGSVVVVGAPGTTVNGQAAAGAVVVYRCPPM